MGHGAVRHPPGPDDDGAEVTAGQVRDVVTRLAEAGHCREGEPPILIIFDAGYDPMRLAYGLADLPVEVLGRLRGDRVLHHDGDHPVGTATAKAGMAVQITGELMTVAIRMAPAVFLT